MIVGTMQIQEVDKPNVNNRMYSTEVIENMIQTIGNRPVFGTIGMPEGYLWETGSVDQFSHQVTNLRIVDGWLIGDVATLGTPRGKMLESLMTTTDVVFRLAGTASLAQLQDPADSPSVISSDYIIHSINAVNASACKPLPEDM